jgi:hypothetical protein
MRGNLKYISFESSVILSTISMGPQNRHVHLGLIKSGDVLQIFYSQQHQLYYSCGIAKIVY